MKERPIIFSSQMVKVILEGRKSQTRRPMKPQPFSVNPNDAFVFLGGQVQVIPRLHLICPYGIVGDRLWVREGFVTQCGMKGRYKADAQWFDLRSDYKPNHQRPNVPSIHMPRWASRITLEIVNVGVERLQEITEEDAKREGPSQHIKYPVDFYCFWRTAFRELWDSIYSKKGMGWSVNPYVWVIEFRRLP